MRPVHRRRRWPAPKARRVWRTSWARRTSNASTRRSVTTRPRSRSWSPRPSTPPTASAAQVKALGGQVTKTSDAVGYLSAKVPTGSVKQVAALGDVDAVDLDEIFRIPDPRPESKAGASATALAAVAGPSALDPGQQPVHADA